MGIVVDADANVAARWNQIRSHIRKVHAFELPDTLNPQGLVLDCDTRGINLRIERFGVWIMPDNQSHGMLEDFMAQLIPSTDRCWPFAQETTLQAQREHDAPFPQKAISKAQIHTWLAWQKEPGKPLGQSITKTYFDSDTPAALAFVSWMRRLFFD